MRIAVGLSGGVDSSVAAKLLVDAGHEVVGVHLVCWPPKSEVEKDGLTRTEWIKKNGCRADEDRASALKSALEIGIPFKVLDFSEEYNLRVVDYFYKEYEMGRTPNPDILCNSEIKFGLFLDWAIENNFDKIATGHYAKISVGSTLLSKNGNVNDSSESLRPATQLADPYGDQAQQASVNFSSEVFSLHDCSLDNPASENSKNISSEVFSLHDCSLDNPASARINNSLYVPKDTHKDQTYFLWKLSQEQLNKAVFPLGDYLKTEVREMATKWGLSVADKKDSQGICFVGNVEAREFLSRRLVKKIGEVKNIAGEVLGKHDGVWFYTIGQRGGWELSGKAQKKYAPSGETPAFYVISKDATKNELVVGFGASTYSEEFSLSSENWFGDKPAGKIEVRIRHTGKLLEANLEGNKVSLVEPQRGIAAGQSAVFYKEGRVCGGGVIE